MLDGGNTVSSFLLFDQHVHLQRQPLPEKLGHIILDFNHGWRRLVYIYGRIRRRKHSCTSCIVVLHGLKTLVVKIRDVQNPARKKRKRGRWVPAHLLGPSGGSNPASNEGVREASIPEVTIYARYCP